MGLLTYLGLALGGVPLVKYTLIPLRSPLRKSICENMIVDVPQGGHEAKTGDVNKPISFCIDVIRPSGLPMKATNIEYEILYDNATIQRRTHTRIEEMKEKGLRSRIDLLYYPRESPMGIPDSPNKWGIRGTMTIDCLYGTFTKDFGSGRMLTVSSAIPWHELQIT